MTVVPNNEWMKAEVSKVDGVPDLSSQPDAARGVQKQKRAFLVQALLGFVTAMWPELPDTRERDRKDMRTHVTPPSGFRALVALDSPYLERDGRRYQLNSGMLVSA
jgi:hypothetical protein